MALAFLAPALPAAAQGTQVTAPLRVDASAPFVPAKPADYVTGANRTPGGSVIGVTDRYLTLDGKPWLPVMGELHYTRVPEAEWEDEILKMKSAGVDIISTYLIWIHHEEVRGEWDWTGQRNLRHFAELCRKHHMMLYVRIGPWAHGEARNGGFPDWVVEQGPVRELDPKFMAAVQTLYQQIGTQLREELWKDGGPVVGVQIENEYVSRGPRKGEEYILALKHMAIQSGLDVPLYSVTGWDNAVVPPHEVLPVYGGYPDAPWGSSRTELPPQEVYAFRFSSRVSGNMGMIGPTGEVQKPAIKSNDQQPKTPFLTAELGGGIEGTYHRRPVVSADDVVAMMPVMLGSGVNGYGTYMFHGGENPTGRLSSLQESQATHYPTDVPEKSYDFEAPISAFGIERPSLRLLKQWNYFLNDFGSLLAPMPAFAPAILPTSLVDLNPLRWSVRTDGHAGFLFVNNYVRQATMPAHRATQFTVALPGGRTQNIPETPVDIPSGAYFAWPFGLNLGTVPLRYATAQLMARLHDGTGEVFVFACIRDVRCELALEGDALEMHTPPGTQMERRSGATIISRIKDSAGMEPVTVLTKAGTLVRLLLLSPSQAAESWKVGSDGMQRLLQTSADVLTEGNQVTMQQLGDSTFRYALYPTPNTLPTGSAPARREKTGSYVADLPHRTIALEKKQLQPAGAAPPVRLGPPLNWRPEGVAQAPGEQTWSADAASWSVHTLVTNLDPNMPDLFLRVSYTGDAARLKAAGKLLDDNFFDGEPWVVGLKRFTTNGAVPPLELEVLPMRADAPVYLPPAARERIAKTGQTVALDGITIIPHYRFRLQLP